MKKILLLVLVILVVGLAGLRIFLPPWVDAGKNLVLEHAPYPISAEAQALHDSLRIMDWHSDFLLWDRNLLESYSYGHGDLPRMQEGNLAIQMFTAVTKSPSGQNYSENSAQASDRITSLVIAQTWPIRTFTSLTERALYQAERLHRFAENSGGQLMVVTTAPALQEALAARASTSMVIGLLGIEGLHALDGQLASVDRLYDAGYRMMGLQHFFDNKLGGSLHGESGAGLTDFGKQVVRKLNEGKIIIDLSHSSEAVVEEVLSISTMPVVMSHTGVKGACDTERNIQDDLVKRIAEGGGLIAIGFWEGAICDFTPEGLVDSIRYAVDLVGIDHVALGSDYDGTVTTSFDVSELAVITQALLAEGFSEEEIGKIMGENSIQFLLKNLPET